MEFRAASVPCFVLSPRNKAGITAPTKYSRPSPRTKPPPIRLRKTTPLILDANTTYVDALKREHRFTAAMFLKPSHVKLFMSMVDQRATQLAGKKQSKKILKTRRKKSVRN